MRHLILLLVLLHPHSITTTFSPDTSDFDAYGLKIAANDVLFAQAKNQAKTFLVQFAPYNFTRGSLQCNIDFADQSHYVYSVAVGSKQNLSANPYFYYTGEVLALGPRSTDRFGQNGTLISVMSNRDPAAIASNIAQDRPLQCDGFQSEPAQYLSSYGHQEFFVIAVEPYGQYAIGLATNFVFRYQPYNNSYRMFSQNSSTVWPNSATFQPCAADATTSFTIVAGFLKNSGQSRVRAAPTVYLLWNSNLTVLSTWTFTATNNTWQARLAYPNVDSWSNGLTMSVKINGDDPTRVLVGMPFLNTVFLFQVSNDGKNLTMASSMSYNDTVGFGKGVTWLSSNQAAILYSSYAPDYTTWFSSKVYVYTWLNDTTLPSSPTAVIPNAQQPLPSTINAKFIRLISTPSTVAILDQAGGAILITSESPGLYASTDTTNSPVAAAMPVVSHSISCNGGMFKADRGIHPCVLCPAGSRNPERAAAATCINCSADSFCPLGAVYELSKTSISSLSQAVVYPRPPESTVYEDILLNNMVTLGSTLHCLRVSPMFWTLILMLIIVIMLLGMASLNLCVKEPKRTQWRTMVKNVFLRTDLVGEGELWLGGIASLAVVLVTAIAYNFAISYLNQYPSEKVGPSSFACDDTIRNAKFDSSLKSLAVPESDVEKVMFDLLDEQEFSLQVEFVNTAMTCRTLSMVEVIEWTTSVLSKMACRDENGTVTARVVLPQHSITVRAVVSEVQLVGGLRVGMTGPGQSKDLYTLQGLNFSRAIYSSSAKTLAQQATIKVTLSKIINETESLSNDDSEFGGIWYPTFTYSESEMFIDAAQYVTSANLSSTTLTLTISETPYYIKNVQSPIAKKPEVIFRTLLFAFLCLEMCAMAFLIFKLIIVPVYHKIRGIYSPGDSNVVVPEAFKESHHH